MSPALAFAAVALAVAALAELVPVRGQRPRRALPGLRLMPAKLAGATLSGLLALPLVALAPGRLGVFLQLAAPVAGFMAPDAWLARRTRQRHAAVRRTLPALLELLSVTVGAGLPPAAAMAAVGARASGPLAESWRALGREVELGVAFPEALATLEARLPMQEVELLCAALRRAARHGAPLAGTLAEQARDARLERRRRIQEEAARAGPKIQLVVALLLVPSVLLLVAAALAAALLDSGGVTLSG